MSAATSEVVLTYVDGHVERLPFGPNGLVFGVDRWGNVLSLRGVSRDGGTEWSKSIPTMNLRAWWTETDGQVS